MTLLTTGLVPVDVFLVSYMKDSSGTFKVIYGVIVMSPWVTGMQMVNPIIKIWSFYTFLVCIVINSQDLHQIYATGAGPK